MTTSQRVFACALVAPAGTFGVVTRLLFRGDGNVSEYERAGLNRELHNWNEAECLPHNGLNSHPRLSLTSEVETAK